jgi:amino acid adenylation domain-containing protein
MLGALAAGAAYVPLEPTHPPQRLGLLLADAGVTVVVAHDRLLAGVDAGDATVVPVDRPREGRDDPPDVESDPEQPAYVVYTSGSSGRPKGVEVPHRAVANLLAHMRRVPGLTAEDVVANVTTPAFDLSVPDWWLPLTTGARLVVVPAEATFDPLELGDRLAAARATFVQATPTTWRMLVDAGWPGHRALTVVCGGEELPPGLAAELLGRARAVWHAYGPTETTVWSSLRRLEAEDGRPWLGGPIANTRFRVLDEGGRPQPVGVPGELHIGGDGVAHGYLGLPDLTAERFLPDTTVSGGRIYRTGDLVERRADGTLRFLGRLDDQAKLRGFRIEPGEVEAVLAEQPGVAAAACAVRSDSAVGSQLVAYVVGSEELEPAPERIRQRLRELLPGYMVPSAVVVLDELPAGPNGKLDRAALPAPDGRRRELERAFEPPLTPMEEELAALWSALLGVERIGMEDDFFDLGGHSLLALKLLARVRDSIDVDLPLRVLFERRTVRGLAEAATAALLAASSDADALLAEAEAPGR